MDLQLPVRMIPGVILRSFFEIYCDSRSKHERYMLAPKHIHGPGAKERVSS